MATITGFKCLLGNEELPADAFGNNVAFACPCGHPVVMLARVYHRGMSQKNPSVCRKCGRKFWGRVDKKVIRLESDK